jgi:hypothetical protein
VRDDETLKLTSGGWFAGVGDEETPKLTKSRSSRILALRQHRKSGGLADMRDDEETPKFPRSFRILTPRQHRIGGELADVRDGEETPKFPRSLRMLTPRQHRRPTVPREDHHLFM